MMVNKHYRPSINSSTAYKKSAVASNLLENQSQASTEKHASTVDNAKNENSTVTISGHAKLLSRLFHTDDIHAKPKIEYTTTIYNTSGLVYSFLNSNDRKVIEKAYEYAESKGIDPLEVDHLAFDWAFYRMAGKGGHGDSTGKRFDMEGNPRVNSFSPEDTKIAKEILSSDSMNHSLIDRGFIMEKLHPGKSPKHAVDLSFLKDIITAFSTAAPTENHSQVNSNNLLEGTDVSESQNKRIWSDAALLIERLDYKLDPETAAKMKREHLMSSVPNASENLTNEDLVDLISVRYYLSRNNMDAKPFEQLVEMANEYRKGNTIEFLSGNINVTGLISGYQENNPEFDRLNSFVQRALNNLIVNKSNREFNE